MKEAKSLIIRGNVVDIIQRKTYGAELTIENGRITAISPTNNIEDKYILPGLVDAHVHIESSMATPNAFAHAAVHHGTIAAVADPHEIANVLGIPGIDYMINNAKDTPFYFWFGAPSCVPASPFETNGAIINAEQTKQLLEREDIHFLGEVMNYPGVINQDPEVINKIKAAQTFGKPVDGHFPMAGGEALTAYIAAGVQTDHETESLKEAEEKCKQGMFVQIREGSAAKNFDMLLPLLKSFPEHAMFCTDDSHPGWLIKNHILHLVKKALKSGYDLYDTIRAASYNPAKHYSLPMGFLQIGDYADFIIADNLENLTVESVYWQGSCIYEEGKTLFPEKTAEICNNFHARLITPEQIEVHTKKKEMRVIVCREGDLTTQEEILPVHTPDGFVESDIDRDIMKLVVINRYNKKAMPAIGFIKGMGLKWGAVAQSIAHDSHNIIAVGASDYEITKAINAVIKEKGGIAVACMDEVSILPLPIAGLMSPLSIKEIHERYEEIEKKIKALKTPLSALQMNLAFMGLTVIPELKLSDQGLFDSKKFEFTNLFI